MPDIKAEIRYSDVGPERILIDGHDITDSVFRYEISRDAKHGKPKLVLEFPWVKVTTSETSGDHASGG